jgi:hypothetical protein
MHVRFFFDTVPPTKAGMPAKGPWYLCRTHPVQGLQGLGSAGQGDQMCILVANPDPSVIQKTGNCVDPPELTRDRGVSIKRGDLVGRSGDRRRGERIAADDDLTGEIETVIRRLDEPLRVAIAGRTRPASRLSSTRWSANDWRRPTQVSARGS